MFFALVIIFGSMIIIAEIGVLSFILSGNWIVSLLVTCAAALLVVFLCSLYFRDKPILAQKIQTVCEIILAIAFVNFITFFFISLIIGGSAPIGKIDGEHYYVGDHGHFREVPFIIYLYSLIHTYSLFITHPLVFLAGWVHFSTGGGNMGRLPHLQKMLSQKNKRNHENQLPKSNY